MPVDGDYVVVEHGLVVNVADAEQVEQTGLFEVTVFWMDVAEFEP